MSTRKDFSKYNAVKTSPAPEQIRAMRQTAQLSQTAAAEKVYATLRSWQEWESGSRSMHPGLFELFEIKLAMPDLFATNEEITAAAKGRA